VKNYFENDEYLIPFDKVGAVVRRKSTRAGNIVLEGNIVIYSVTGSVLADLIDEKDARIFRLSYIAWLQGEVKEEGLAHDQVS